MALFPFKQFLIRPQKKDLGGEVGADQERGMSVGSGRVNQRKGTFLSSDSFNRLLAGVGGSDMA